MPSWDIKPAITQKEGLVITKPDKPAKEGVIKGSVIILVPHRNELDYREWRDWFLFGLKRPQNTSWREARGQSLVTARNRLVDDALGTNAEYIFFLDDDVIGPGDGLMKLIDLKQPIACGLYWAKKRKEQRCLGAWMKNPGGPGFVAISGGQKGRLVQVDVTGLGFALIHRSIFEKLSKPYFHWPPEGPSEDFWFFEKVWKELQIKPVIDMECRCRHIGVFTIESDGGFQTLEK